MLDNARWGRSQMSGIDFDDLKMYPCVSSLESCIIVHVD